MIDLKSSELPWNTKSEPLLLWKELTLTKDQLTEPQDVGEHIDYFYEKHSDVLLNFEC